MAGMATAAASVTCGVSIVNNLFATCFEYKHVDRAKLGDRLKRPPSLALRDIKWCWGAGSWCWLSGPWRGFVGLFIVLCNSFEMEGLGG